MLSLHQHVFEKRKELSPSRGEHDHNIPLVLGTHPANIRPYKHPFAQKNEIENIMKELQEASIIFPITNFYSSLEVMVLKKYGEWHMCRELRALNKITIEDKFLILVVDDLLDEIHGT